jgi:hypothetical protein
MGVSRFPVPDGARAIALSMAEAVGQEVGGSGRHALRVDADCLRGLSSDASEYKAPDRLRTG